jgi:hypothetical protein
MEKSIRRALRIPHMLFLFSLMALTLKGRSKMGNLQVKVKLPISKIHTRITDSGNLDYLKVMANKLLETTYTMEIS